jgi:hypothetical protein
MSVASSCAIENEVNPKSSGVSAYEYQSREKLFAPMGMRQTVKRAPTPGAYNHARCALAPYHPIPAGLVCELITAGAIPLDGLMDLIWEHKDPRHPLRWPKSQCILLLPWLVLGVVTH